MTILLDQEDWPPWWINYTSFYGLVFLNDQTREQFKKDNIEYDWTREPDERRVTFTSEEAYLMFVLKWA